MSPPIAWQINDDNPRIKAICRDLSLGGMFIETTSPPAFGSTIRVYLTVPHMKEEAVVTAIVRWTAPTGMGVQFGVMGARETHGLTELLGDEAIRTAAAS